MMLISEHISQRNFIFLIHLNKYGRIRYTFFLSFFLFKNVSIKYPDPMMVMMVYSVIYKLYIVKTKTIFLIISIQSVQIVRFFSLCVCVSKIVKFFS